MVYDFLSCERRCFYRLLCCRSFNAPIDKRAVIAVLFPVQEDCFKAVAKASLLIGKTTAAITWEIRVLVRERMSVFARIVFKSTLWLGRFHVIRTVDRFISSFERAFAVPTVPRVMIVPERIIDGQRELLEPIGSVCAFRLW